MSADRFNDLRLACRAPGPARLQQHGLSVLGGRWPVGGEPREQVKEAVNSYMHVVEEAAEREPSAIARCLPLRVSWRESLLEVQPVTPKFSLGRARTEFQGPRFHETRATFTSSRRPTREACVEWNITFTRKKGWFFFIYAFTLFPMFGVRRCRQSQTLL